ncbi:MAG: hypothetical protein EOM85_03425 [Candidatus Moranbacteria bacterium]|nr:hypothetical protein [Candidatus Moranbacteria bacterium]
MRYDKFKEIYNEAADMVRNNETIEDIWEFLEKEGIRLTVKNVINFVNAIEAEDGQKYCH